METNAFQECIVCAWRAVCAKRFQKRAGVARFCEDFSEDKTLRPQKTAETASKSFFEEN
jgi:hypothetical protein